VTIAFPDEPELPGLRKTLAAVEAATAPLRAQTEQLRRVFASTIPVVTIPQLQLPELDAAVNAARVAMSAQIAEVLRAESASLRHAVEAATRAAESAFWARRNEVRGTARADLGGLTATARAEVLADVEAIAEVAERERATPADFDGAIRWLATKSASSTSRSRT
jgi:hypothetical protein